MAAFLTRNTSMCDGEQEPYICVSLAYRYGERPRLSISATKSAVYRTNRIGPITEPWGTPQIKWTAVDVVEP